MGISADLDLWYKHRSYKLRTLISQFISNKKILPHGWETEGLGVMGDAVANLNEEAIPPGASVSPPRCSSVKTLP